MKHFVLVGFCAKMVSVRVLVPRFGTINIMFDYKYNGINYVAIGKSVSKLQCWVTCIITVQIIINQVIQDGN